MSGCSRASSPLLPQFGGHMAGAPRRLCPRAAVQHRAGGEGARLGGESYIPNVGAPVVGDFTGLPCAGGGSAEPGPWDGCRCDGGSVLSDALPCSPAPGPLLAPSCVCLAATGSRQLVLFGFAAGTVCCWLGTALGVAAVSSCGQDGVSRSPNPPPSTGLAQAGVGTGLPAA